jgi:hypothetical protein
VFDVHALIHVSGQRRSLLLSSPIPVESYGGWVCPAAPSSLTLIAEFEVILCGGRLPNLKEGLALELRILTMGPHHIFGERIRLPMGAGQTPSTCTRHYAMSPQRA